MLPEISTAFFDTLLNIEAYHFKGMKQKFPNHFHEYYVIGLIENGRRYLLCKGKEYILRKGDLLILNPKDNHTCHQVDDKALDYRCINIQVDIMEKLVFEVTGEKFIPCFNQSVVFNSDLIVSLRELHHMIIQQQNDFKKEELLFFIIEQLLYEYSNPVFQEIPKELTLEIKAICEFLEVNFRNSICLNDLVNLTGLSKYYLLHSFTKQKGISPYTYLENIRIGNAKNFLEQGMLPMQVALETGFSDQSHFSNFFKKFIGLTPKQYMKIFKPLGNR